MEIQKPQRPLIDRPRYVSKPSNVVNVKPNNNKTVNKKNPNKQQQKRKVVNKEILEQQMQKKQMQQPVSGSVNTIGEAVKVKPPVKPKPSQKRKTKNPPPTPPHKPKAPKEEKKDDGLFKQMKDKFVGKSKDEGGN